MLHYDNETRTLTDSDGNVIEGRPTPIHYDDATGSVVTHDCMNKDGLTWDDVNGILSWEKYCWARDNMTAEEFKKNFKPPTREEIFRDYVDAEDLIDRLWKTAHAETYSGLARYAGTQRLYFWANRKLSLAIDGDKEALRVLCRMDELTMDRVETKDVRRSLWDRVDGYNSVLVRAHELRSLREIA